VTWRVDAKQEATIFPAQYAVTFQKRTEMYWAVIHAVFGLLLAAPDTTASIVHTRPATGQQNAFSIKVCRVTCDERDVGGLVAQHFLVLGMLLQCCMPSSFLPPATVCIQPPLKLLPSIHCSARRS
jgi:hypothetical protein